LNWPLSFTSAADRPSIFRTTVNVDAPAFADNLAFIGDLATRFGVERRLAQENRNAIPSRRRSRGHLGLNLD